MAGRLARHIQIKERPPLVKDWCFRAIEVLGQVGVNRTEQAPRKGNHLTTTVLDRVHHPVGKTVVELAFTILSEQAGLAQ